MSIDYDRKPVSVKFGPKFWHSKAKYRSDEPWSIASQLAMRVQADGYILHVIDSRCLRICSHWSLPYWHMIVLVRLANGGHRDPMFGK